MKRCIVIAVVLLGAAVGNATTAMADSPKDHQVCLVLSDSSNYRQGSYICVDTPGQVFP